MLEYYAERLNGVELNGSFYRTPPETALMKWASQTPAGFRFCMKGNRGLTYSAEAFDKVGLARILAEGLGPPVAAEFRHESWFCNETYRVIREHQGALVVTDEEKWPRAPSVDLGPLAYFRLRRGYTIAAMKPWVAEVQSAMAAHDEVHVYFKHDPEAPGLAQRLLRAVTKL